MNLTNENNFTRGSLNPDRIIISVIIPVYNAEKYLRNAVESAVQLSEVGEVILVEDASPDNAWELCQQLEKEFDKVRLFRHENGANKGAGASRNLGIEKAKYKYVSFLDADDWYLPNRFSAEKELFKNPAVDGVYGPTGFYYEGKGIEEGRFTSIKQKVLPEDLLYYILTHDDSFTTNAITVKRELLFECGLFDTNLELHQDTHLWYRLILKGKLYTGIIDEAIAIRRVHPENRIKNRSKESRNLLHQAVFNDFKNMEVPRNVMRILFNRYVHTLSNNRMGIYYNYFTQLIKNPRFIRLCL